MKPERRTVDGWSAVASFAFGDGGRIVAGENGGFRVCCWDAAGTLVWQRELQKAGKDSRYNYETYVITVGDAVLALPKYGGKLVEIDLASGEIRKEHPIHGSTRTHALTPDNKTLVLRVSTETTLLDYPSFKEVAHFDNYCNQNEIAISPDGQWLAVCGHEVHVFDLPKRKHVKTFEPPESPWDMCFTASSAELVTGDRKQMLRVYDVAHDFGLLIEKGKNRSPTITAVAASPDGRFIAAANELGTVAVHNASTLEIARELKGHDPSQPDTGARTISKIAFGPKGELVVSAAPKKQTCGLTIHTL